MSDESGSVMGLIGIGLVIWIGFEGWPVTWWLGVAGASYWVLLKLKEKYAAQPETTFRRSLWNAILSGTTTSCGYFAIGIACVWIAQLLSQLVGNFISDQTVHAAEDMLAQSQYLLRAAFAPAYVVVVLVVLVTMTFVAPELKLAARFGRLRRYVSRAGATLAGITSFTFFTAAGVTATEGAWVAERRSEVDADLSHIKRLAPSVEAMKRVSLEMRRLPIPIVKEVRDFLVSVESHPNREMLLAWRATKIAEKVAEEADATIEERPSDLLTPSQPPTSGRGMASTLADLERWSGAGEQATVQPTLHQVETLRDARERLTKQFNEGEAILSETLKTVLAAGIPAGAEATVKLFAKSLTGAISSSVAKQTFKDPSKWLSRAALYLNLASLQPYFAVDPTTEPDPKLVERWSLSKPSADTGAGANVDADAAKSREYLAYAEQRMRSEGFVERYNAGYHPEDPEFRATVSGVSVRENGRTYEAKPVEHVAPREGYVSHGSPEYHPIPHEAPHIAPHPAPHYTPRIVPRR